MQLIHHHYAGRPARYYIDGKRVSRHAYDYAIIRARIRQRPHRCFVTRILRSAPDLHVVHYSTLG